MATVATSLPNSVLVESPPPEFASRTYKFSVRQYERMTEIGVLDADDRVELLDGLVIENQDIMTQNPPHNVSVDCTRNAVEPLLPDDWYVREQKAIRLSASEPEPDLAVVRGPARRYLRNHPTPADIGLVIEVGDSSLEQDRDWKGAIYARARIAEYWIVNIPERKVEVYTEPKGGKSPAYRRRRDYGPDQFVPLTLQGRELGKIRVGDLLP